MKGSGFNGDGTTAKYGCHEPNATDHSASPLCVARIIAILGCIADTSDNVDSTSRRRVRSSCKVGTPPESWFSDAAKSNQNVIFSVQFEPGMRLISLPKPSPVLRRAMLVPAKELGEIMEQLEESQVLFPRL